MDRVLSFRPSRGCNGQSDYVRKSFCISIVFVVGFMSFFAGYFMGRVSMQHEYLLKNQRHLFVTPHGTERFPKVTSELNKLSVIVDNLLNATEFLKTQGIRHENIRDVTQAFSCTNISAILKVENESLFNNLNQPEEGLISVIIERIMQEHIYFIKRCFESAQAKLEFINL